MKRNVWSQIDQVWRSVFDGTFTAEEIFVTVDDFEFGWLTMTLSTSDGRKFMVEMSDVYSPLCDLREMLKGWTGAYGVTEIVIDSEGYRCRIGMKSTGVYDDVHNVRYGVLTCYYIDTENEESLVAVVDMNRVAISIYTAVKERILRSKALLKDPELWHDTDLIEEYSDGKLHPKTYRKELFNRYFRIPWLDRDQPRLP